MPLALHIPVSGTDGHAPHHNGHRVSAATAAGEPISAYCSSFLDYSPAHRLRGADPRPVRGSTARQHHNHAGNAGPLSAAAPQHQPLPGRWSHAGPSLSRLHRVAQVPMAPVSLKSCQPCESSDTPCSSGESVRRPATHLHYPHHALPTLPGECQPYCRIAEPLPVLPAYHPVNAIFQGGSNRMSGSSA